MKELFLLAFSILLFSFTFAQSEESDRLPSFPGGDYTRIHFISENFHYPMEALSKHIEGKVYISILVDTTGKLSDIKVLKGIGFGCDKEAIRIVEAMPDWIPGRQHGVLKNVVMNFTINFKITEEVERKYNKAIKNYKKAVKQYDDENYEETIKILEWPLSEFPDYFEALQLCGLSYQHLNDSIYACNVWKTALHYGHLEIAEMLVKYCDEGDEEFSLLNNTNIFVVVEEMPEYPGGKPAMSKYVAENIQYPTNAYLDQIEGRVYLTFVVEKNGEITDVRSLRGIGHGCDEEAIRIVQNMPNWNPGKQRGIPVRVQYNLPVLFVIGEEAKQQMNEANNIYSEALRHFESANYSETISLLNKAIELSPWYIDAFILRGNAFKEINDLENACIDWNIAKEIGSDELEEIIEEFCKN